MKYIPYIGLLVGLVVVSYAKINHAKKIKNGVDFAYTKEENITRYLGYAILLGALLMAYFLGL